LAMVFCSCSELFKNLNFISPQKSTPLLSYF
jgi:hypothetical protein